jgi:hypothetical protein
MNNKKQNFCYFFRLSSRVLFQEKQDKQTKTMFNIIFGARQEQSHFAKPRKIAKHSSKIEHN